MISIPQPIKWLVTHPVTRLHPVRTFARWGYWQLRQRITSKPMLFQWIDHTQLQVYPKGALTGNWYVELPDYTEMTFLRRFLNAGDVFYDIGANVGAYTILAAARGCKALALEPVPTTFAMLQENIALNPALLGVTPLNLAVGSETGSCLMTQDRGTGNCVIYDEDHLSAIKVDIVTLDDMASQYSPPIFIKIDVEGYELEVVKGAKAILANEQLQGFCIETFRTPGEQFEKIKRMESLLFEAGFHACTYDPHANRIDVIHANEATSNNTFYLRNPPQIQLTLNKHSSS